MRRVVSPPILRVTLFGGIRLDSTRARLSLGDTDMRVSSDFGLAWPASVSFRFLLFPLSALRGVAVVVVLVAVPSPPRCDSAFRLFGCCVDGFLDGEAMMTWTSCGLYKKKEKRKRKKSPG